MPSLFDNPLWWVIPAILLGSYFCNSNVKLPKTPTSSKEESKQSKQEEEPKATEEKKE